MLKYVQRKDNNKTLEEDNIPSSSESVEKRKKRKINNDWFSDPEIKLWAEKQNDVLYCKFCNTQLKISSGKSDIIAHTKSKKHLQAANVINQTKIDTLFPVEKYSNKIAEINLALFIVEHNLPFAVADHMTKVCQKSFPDSEIVANVTLGRTKATAIVKNLVGKRQFLDICDILKTNRFSLCVDESTDLSDTKSLCLVVRVCIDFEIRDLFFGLLTVDECDATSLYNLITNHFNENNIDYKKNMIGFAADGAAVMTGKNHSVAQLLKKDIPGLFIIKCVCHSLALCSNYACLQLPPAVETLARNIYNYISNSPKRTSQFDKIQKLLDIKPKRILHPCQTRWLSLEIVVIRLLDLFEILKIYFSFAVNIDKIDTAISILSNLNETNQIYLSFLKYILFIINNINKIFQSETTEIHNLYLQMERLLKIVMSNFLKDYLINTDKIFLVDYNNESNFLDDANVYLGVYAKEILIKSNLNQNEKNDIINHCRNFYIELCNQILKRFDFEDKFKYLSIITPNLIIDKRNLSIFGIVKEFPNFVNNEEKQMLDSEFRELQLLDLKNICNKNETNLLNFWKQVCALKQNDSSYIFPTLRKFIKNILILPHSSANVERIFSKVNINKTKLRNRLEKDTLEGILFTKDYLKLKKSNCFDTPIKPDLLKMYNNNIY